MQVDGTNTGCSATVVLDIETSAQLSVSDRSSGSPKMTKKLQRTLSRKWSYKPEKWSASEEEDKDEPTKKPLIRVNSQLEPLKQSLISNKAPIPATTNLSETTDGKHKRFSRFMAINPRKILFIFASVSSMGTLILIYFTLAINGAI